jgi:lysozyme family protein
MRNPKVFNMAFEIIKDLEGDLTDDLKDPGGLTKWGVSSRYHPQVLNRDFSESDARTVYITDYWKKSRADLLKWPILAISLFQISVNVGVKTGAMLLQGAINISKTRGVDLKIDGILGDVTMKALNDYDDTAAMLLEMNLRAAYIGARIQSAKGNAVQTGYLSGHMNRVTSNYYLAVKSAGVPIWS